MFTKLKNHAGTDSALLALITEAETTANKVKEDLIKSDSKIVDLKTSRDKYKSLVTTVKKDLKIKDGEELTSELISSSIKNVVDGAGAKAGEKEIVLQSEIDNLSKLIKENETVFAEKLAEKDAEVFNTKFDVRVKDTLSSLELVNANARKMVESEVKNGVVFDSEVGEFVYKNADGTNVRNQDGTVMTVEQKVEQVKNSDDFSFLFKAPANSGSGTNTGDAGGAVDPFSAIANRA